MTAETVTTTTATTTAAVGAAPGAVRRALARAARTAGRVLFEGLVVMGHGQCGAGHEATLWLARRAARRR